MEETQEAQAKNLDADIDSSQTTDLINAFIEITSSSNQEALFFLESHNFDLDSAVSTFLESTSVPDARAEAARAPPRRSCNRNRSPSDSPSPSLSPSPSPSRSRSRSPPPSVELELPVNTYNLRSRRSDNKASGSRARSVRTISDLNRPDSGDDSGSDSDERQEYYTGGEKSGMLVQDPPKVDDVEALFNQARQAGAQEGPIDHLQPSSSSRRFSGRARLLSGETVSSPSALQEPHVVTHTITFWTNGFTVDDGPLRRLDDPENSSFLESIRKSECPKELKPATKGAAAHVNLVRKLEECPVPQKCKKPFQGVGRTLGSTSGTVTEENTVPETILTTAPSPSPSMGLVVDQTLPSTSIQLRLVDGTRMVSCFNFHHTIHDIRSFIDASRPDGQRAYQLQIMGFPPKQLTDLNQTIEQAGLANTVVIQKL